MSSTVRPVAIEVSLSAHQLIVIANALEAEARNRKSRSVFHGGQLADELRSDAMACRNVAEALREAYIKEVNQAIVINIEGM